MATRFWVGGTGNWDAVTTTHWAATSGAAGGASVPGSADTVTFDANSGTTATVTLTTNPSVSSVTVNKSDLTLTNGGTQTLTIATDLTLTTGTVNMTAQTMTWGAFVYNAGTATINITNADITCNTGSANAWNTGSDTTASASLTITSTGSTIRVTGSGSSFQGGSKTYNSLVLSGAGARFIKGGNTFTGTVTHSATGNLQVQQVNLTNTYVNLSITLANETVWQCASGTTQSVSGTLTLAGTAANQRGVVRGITDATVGSNNYTIALGATGTVTATDIIFVDAKFTGTNTPFSGTRLGDFGNNVGITFGTGVNKYWVGGTGSWSDPTNHWSTTTGGAGGANNMPLPQDTAVFDSSSFSANGQTITQDRAWLSGIDASALNRPSNYTASTSVITTGTVTWSSSFTYSGAIGAFPFGTSTINLGNAILPFSYSVIRAGATVTFAGSGTFLVLAMSGGTLAAGSSVITLTSTGTPISFTGGTFTASTSKIIVSDTSSATKTIAGNGAAFNILALKGTADKYTITGANTYNWLYYDGSPPRADSLSPSGGVNTRPAVFKPGANPYSR